MNLDYRSLRMLVKVVELGSMSDAARALGVTQSTVSHCIDRLRDHLQDPLFYREGRQVAPTQHLLRIVPAMRQILADIEGLQNGHSFDGTEFDGVVAVGGNVTELLPLFQAFQARLAEALPKAQVRFLEVGSRDNLGAVLSSAQVLLAINARLPNALPQILSEPLFDDHQKVFYDPSVRGPIESIEDYRDARHVMLDFGGSAPSFIELELARAGITRQVPLAVPNVACLAEFLAGTDMIATMAGHLQKFALKSLSCSGVPFTLRPLGFDLSWHRRNAEDALVDEVRTHMIAAAQKVGLRSPLAEPTIKPTR